MSAIPVMLGIYRVGTIDANEGQVLGEGAPLNPHLRIPITVSLDPRPISQQLALTDLWCTLSLDETLNGKDQVGAPVPVFSESIFLATSPRIGESERSYTLRFPMPLATTHFVEDLRHNTLDHDFVAYLKFHARICWVSGVGNSITGITGEESQTIPNNPFADQINLGMLYTLAPFNAVTIAPLRIRVSSSEWVRHVLPGVGYDRVRVIELVLSRANEIVPESVIKYLDEAVALYDAGRYRDAISRCRDARNALENALGADSKHKIADIVVERLGLRADDPRREFMVDAWSTYSKLTNAGPHYWRAERLGRADALLCLDMTAIFVEYLGAVLG